MRANCPPLPLSPLTINPPVFITLYADPPAHRLSSAPKCKAMSKQTPYPSIFTLLYLHFIAMTAMHFVHITTLAISPLQRKKISAPNRAIIHVSARKGTTPNIRDPPHLTAARAHSSSSLSTQHPTTRHRIQSTHR
jgi:hypothetical protein